MEQLAAVHRTAFDDLDGLQSQIKGLDLEIVPLRTGAFSGQTTSLVARDFYFTHGVLVSDQRYRGTSPPQHVLLGIHFGPEGTASFDSNVALQGDLSILQPGTENFGRSGGKQEYAALALSPEDLFRQAADFVGNDALFIGNGHLRAPAPVRASVCRTMARITRTAFEPVGHDRAGRLESLRRSVLYPYLVVAALGTPERERSIAGSRANLVRRAEAWLDAQAPEQLHVIDLCRALGQSMRTAQRAFHETLGIGLAEYLTYYRLRQVRRSLLTCDPTSTRITDVALDHGFWELGRFAGLYRRVYGERPSETLSRRR